jgi:hypothetical protein
MYSSVVKQVNTNIQSITLCFAQPVFHRVRLSVVKVDRTISNIFKNEAANLSVLIGLLI